MGGLNIEIPLVVSNREELRALVESHGHKFLYLPVTPETKESQETQILKLVAELNIDFVVLARYMQIMSADFCSKLQGSD